MLIRNLSPDNDGGGAAEENPFAKLSSVDDLLVEDAPAENKDEKEEKPTAPPANEEKPVEEEHEAAEKLAKEKADKIAAEKKDAPPADNKEQKPADGFKTPGDEATPNSTDEDSSWINLAKEMGFETTEDSFDAFKKSQEDYITAKLNEQKQSDFHTIIADLPVKEQVIMRGLRAGLTLEQLDQPRKTLESYKNMSDAQLLEADLKARGLKEDAINYQIDKLVESEKLELEVAPIRQMLKQREDALEQSLLEDITAIEADLKTKKDKELADDYSTFEKVANTIDEFMGTKLSKKNIDYIVQNYKSGKYHDVLTDHKSLIQYLLYKEYGTEAQTNLINNTLENERRDKKYSVHNVPVNQRNGGTTQKVAVPTNGQKPAMAIAAEEEQ